MTSLTGLQEALRQPTATPSSGFCRRVHRRIDRHFGKRRYRTPSSAWPLGLARVRELGGRLFILGVGGSAGHAGHAVNDFRKLCGFEAYAPTDNVSELTARANDEGWDTCFAAWLQGSRIGPRDGVLVFSVGGGSREKNVSVNIVRALETASEAGAHIFGIVGLAD